MEALNVFDEPSLENVFKTVMETAGMKSGKIVQPVRVALQEKQSARGYLQCLSCRDKPR